MNVQVLTDPFGRLLWVSTALPGAVRDIKAARTHGIIDAITEARVTRWADKRYQGAGGTLRIPFRAASTATSPPGNGPSTWRTPASAPSAGKVRQTFGTCNLSQLDLPGTPLALLPEKWSFCCQAA